jgi:hypothetical protein
MSGRVLASCKGIGSASEDRGTQEALGFARVKALRVLCEIHQSCRAALRLDQHGKQGQRVLGDGAPVTLRAVQSAASLSPSTITGSMRSSSSGAM